MLVPFLMCNIITIRESHTVHILKTILFTLISCDISLAYPLLLILQHKFKLGRVLLSKCFSEADGTTFAHVNFTAAPEHSPTNKRLFFAELMLIPDLQPYEDMELMRVLNVCTIDDSCFGKFQ